MLPVPWIDSDAAGDPFPPLERALREPDGLLAIGGNLSPALLLLAYRRGIFPWFGDGDPILWWSPDPRAVFFPDGIRVSRSLGRTLRRGRYRLTLNRDFAAVIARCAAPRAGQSGTWITPPMRDAYTQLWRLGHAHSIEVWSGPSLVGGLYGLAIGRVFFGESMFSVAPDASKVALVMLARALGAAGYRLLDCQVRSAHLYRMGAVDLPRRGFETLLARWCPQQPELTLGGIEEGALQP